MSSTPSSSDFDWMDLQLDDMSLEMEWEQQMVREAKAISSPKTPSTTPEPEKKKKSSPVKKASGSPIPSRQRGIQKKDTKNRSRRDEKHHKSQRSESRRYESRPSSSSHHRSHGSSRRTDRRRYNY